MAIGDDISVAANGDIRYTGTTPNYTVIAFHRWLGDLMDDAQATGDNILDITDATASARSTDNFVIAAAHHLAVFYQYGPDQGVGRGKSLTLDREVQSHLHEMLVIHGCCIG